MADATNILNDGGYIDFNTDKFKQGVKRLATITGEAGPLTHALLCAAVASAAVSGSTTEAADVLGALGKAGDKVKASVWLRKVGHFKIQDESVRFPKSERKKLLAELAEQGFGSELDAVTGKAEGLDVFGAQTWLLGGEQWLDVEVTQAKSTKAIDVKAEIDRLKERLERLDDDNPQGVKTSRHFNPVDLAELQDAIGELEATARSIASARNAAHAERLAENVDKPKTAVPPAPSAKETADQVKQAA